MPAFYGRKKGRKLSPQATSILQDLLPKVQILPSEDPINPKLLFKNNNPLYLEIGFGMGDHLISLIQTENKVNFIGCEPFVNGVSAVLQECHNLELNHEQLKIYMQDARQLVGRLPNNCIDKLFILFPDPWSKARHHKRRIIHPHTIGQFIRILKPSGLLRIATDDQDYMQWIIEIMHEQAKLMKADFDLQKCYDHSDYSAITTQPNGWQATKYERKALAQNKVCYYMDFITIKETA